MVLQVQNLCKEYPQFSLRDISFQLPEGAIMGLIGENGAGKSTTMRMILGMAQPDSGQISVFGHRGVTPQDRESIGVVFDEMPFNQTLYTSHLGRVMKKIYSQWDESAYNQYLQRFSLPDKKEIKDFSRGMKMKLSLAIALSHGAQLLILDEPTAGLDPRERVRLRTLLADMAQDRIILVATHVVSDVESVATKVILLRAGKIVDAAPVPDLIEKHAPGGGLEDVYLNVFGEGDGK
jgi:ABC transporter related